MERERRERMKIEIREIETITNQRNQINQIKIKRTQMGKRKGIVMQWTFQLTTSFGVLISHLSKFWKNV